LALPGRSRGICRVSIEKRRSRLAKLDRLRSGAPPRVLELCSGSGGLALGLKTAGYELSAHVELDPIAAATYAVNFDPTTSRGEAWSRPRDMSVTSAAEISKDLGFDGEANEVFDVLAAGLPCQAFARIGRSKLREVSGDDEAFRNDPRAGLYRRFLDYVDETQPLVVVIENVPDILNFGGHNVPEEICDTLEPKGYTTAYTILNAAHFGVPQVRERLFLVAFARELGVAPGFPVPTRYLDLPRGYKGSRRVALKHVPAGSPRYHPIHDPSRSMEHAVSAKAALGDLPAIREHEASPVLIRRRRLSDRLAYRRGRPSSYARQMRDWSGFTANGEVDGHLVRLTPRDFPIFRRMDRGTDYPRARRLAETMLNEALELRGLSNVDPSDPVVAALRESIVPPYDPGKFPNKWWKLDPALPSRTLTAHMGKDTYSHIHYDSSQARTISVREAARLQSFPDAFTFAGSMNSAFRQIGNAVPPLLSVAVARELKTGLDAAVSGSQDTDRVA
jgi:DNA (cytosine-5)-methyltransferase 1